MKKHIASRTLSVLLVLALAVSMLPVFGIGAAAASMDEVVAAIDAIGTGDITKENFNIKAAAIQAAEAACSAWESENGGALAEESISNYAALKTAQTAYRAFLDDFAGAEYKSYSPEELLALAQDTSVTGAVGEEMVGVKHTGASGALYEELITEYLGARNYTFVEKESYAVNNTEADSAYVHEFTGQTNGGSRFCDQSNYVIYKFDLSKFQNLCVAVEVSQNYVLEATGDPVNGPWTVIADYGVIGGGTRINGQGNKTTYDIIFSDLGITGTGYVRVRNVGSTGGWGGAISKLVLKEATLTGESFLVNPGHRIRLEVDVDIAGAGADEEVLSAAIANGDYTESASITGAELEALEVQYSGRYGYAYRTISTQIRLPSAEDNAALAENLKKSGFTIDISSAATVERKIYRIAVINETTGESLLELTGRELLDKAVAASTPAAEKVVPPAYQTFEPTLALRVDSGNMWWVVHDWEVSVVENERKLVEPGDELILSADIFYEGTDTDDLPGGGNGPRLNLGAKDFEGVVAVDGNIVTTTQYNELELLFDEKYNFEPYKTIEKTFMIPEDNQEVLDVIYQKGLEVFVGNHQSYEEYPFRLYSITLTNVATGEEILYADADSLSGSLSQVVRQKIMAEDVIGGIFNERVGGYGNAVLVNGGFETLSPGMYSYEFFNTVVGNHGTRYATLSAVTESGEILASYDMNQYTNGMYKADHLVFSVTEETKVGFKIDLYNNTNYYLKNVTLNRLLSASELAIQRVINAIDELPAIDELTLDDASKVSSAQKMLERLNETQQQAVSNAQKLAQAVQKIAELEQQAEADAAAAKAVDDAINALPSLKDMVKGDKSKIEEARTAYGNLNERQQPLVTALSVLEAAEARMALLETATDEEIAAAKAVDEQIAALPAVDALVYADGEKVAQARAAYAALSEKAAVLVVGLDILTAAEEKMATLTPDITYGDVDGDGKVNASDALKALQHSVKLITLQDDIFLAADVDKSGVVDATDALYILQKSVNLIDTLPIK